MNRKLQELAVKIRSRFDRWEFTAKASTILIVGSVVLCSLIFWRSHGDGPALVTSYLLPGIVSFIAGVGILPEAIRQARWRRTHDKENHTEESPS